MSKPKKTNGGNFAAGTPWAELNGEVQQDPTRRQKIIRRIESILSVKIVTLFTAFDSYAGMLSDSEAEMLENILSAECDDGDSLVLVINSPGGQALAAERIANICRAYSKDGQFRVIVPHMAKSAATMVCFGASEIMMSKTAELGPVDLQIMFTDDRNEKKWISADEYIRSYDNLMKEASSGNYPRIEPYIQQLNRYDSRFVEQLRSGQQLSKDISVRLLHSGMMTGTPPAEIAAKIEIFLAQSAKSAHGRMIAEAEATDCGLNIKTIDLRSELWRDVWNLYVRSDWVVQNHAAALVESNTASVLKAR